MGKILVTGSDGLLGTALKTVLPDATFVSRRDLDLTKRQEVEAFLQSGDYGPVIHTAAMVGGVAANSATQHSFFERNLTINLNMLDAAKNAGIRRLIAFASTCAFPDNTTYPLVAENLHAGDPHGSNFGYAYAKRMVDVQIRALNQEFGTSFKTVIPANLFGRNDNFDLKLGHVLPSLIHRAHIAERTGREFVVWGDGSPLREFVFADDLARGLQHIVKTSSVTPLIFSHGIETSIRSAAELIARQFGISNRLVFDTTKPIGQLRKPSSLQGMQKELPDLIFTEFGEALEETIRWFRCEYPKVRGA